jgi:hypothetical protein
MTVAVLEFEQSLAVPSGPTVSRVDCQMVLRPTAQLTNVFTLDL